MAIITYSDIKTLKIDDRRNYFMQGYTLALALIGNVVLFYAILSISMFLMNKALKWWENLSQQVILGDGDKKLLQWLVPGCVILGLFMPFLFFMNLMFVLIVLLIIKQFKQDFSKTPGMLFITIAFLLTWAVSLIL